MHKYTLLIFISILSIRCGNKQEQTNDFKESIELKNYNVLFSDKNQPMGTITGIEILDSILIIRHMDDKYYYSFINTNTGNLIKRWGIKGKADDEYINISSNFSISKISGS